MTCRHSPGDPACGSTVGGLQWLTNERAREDYARHRAAERARKNEPRPEEAQIVDIVRVGPHLVIKALYPSCAKCAYEGCKVMVYLDVTEVDAIRWRSLDPHFRDPQDRAKRPDQAPSPAARFPASPEGWNDAIEYARRKAGSRPQNQPGGLENDL